MLIADRTGLSKLHCTVFCFQNCKDIRQPKRTVGVMIKVIDDKGRVPKKKRISYGLLPIDYSKGRGDHQRSHKVPVSKLF